MKKSLAFLGTTVMALGLCLCACSNDVQPDADRPAEDNNAAVELFADVAGTYDELFPVICAPEYDQIWLDACAAAVGEENAAETAAMLKSSCTGAIYGEEAVAAYGDGSNGAQFNCSFINGVKQITFAGNTVSGTDENGQTVFSHEYQDAGAFSLAGLMEGRLYETADADAGEFRYFLLMPDTPATTWHIEFRYGSDKAALAEYDQGQYAYWLAAGILTGSTERTITDVINLFCEENLQEDAAA